MTDLSRIDFGQPRLADRDGPVVYRRWEGPPGRVIVCVHGLSATAAHWAPVAELLRNWATVVAPDLPGFGNTPLCGRQGLTGAREVLQAVVDAEGEGEGVVLLATSMGAAVAAEMAGRHPGRVAGLVIGSGYLPSYFGGWRGPAVVAGLVGGQLGNAGRGLVSSVLRSCLGVKPAATALAEADRFPGWPDVARPSRGQQRRASVRLVAPLAAMACVPRLSRRVYDRIRCPVLLLHGADDPLVPVAWAHRASAEWGWELHVMPAVAHVVKLGAPGWWLDEVGDWLVRQGLLPTRLVSDHPAARQHRREDVSEVLGG